MSNFVVNPTAPSQQHIPLNHDLWTGSNVLDIPIIRRERDKPFSGNELGRVYNFAGDHTQSGIMTLDQAYRKSMHDENIIVEKLLKLPMIDGQRVTSPPLDIAPPRSKVVASMPSDALARNLNRFTIWEDPVYAARVENE